ncbi:ribosome biogenesis GTP-binding protein YihA/YsxC [Helicobacter cynogastricus]|uniref:ribosome biogenesis GTP-binding protein YihA/YsxC n=1 Tax=Helicobacter cynogastricus TaxID=329937 RepID=UPI000CF10A41|nr:ribosome biogenesis GTP-binding protein YihA/YsxC [Helicobacter cynogastricus]
MKPIKVIESSFLKSAYNLAQCPPACAPEVAFVGRSNVGKSTLMNTILERKIAKSSATPGKTQAANFFRTQWQISSTETLDFICIDLPGFGYAKVSKELKQQWATFLSDLLIQRSSIKLILHLIDARHPHLSLDTEVRGFLESFLRPDQTLRCVYTKFDKLSKNAQHALYQQQNAPLVSAQGALNSRFGSSFEVQKTILEALFDTRI